MINNFVTYLKECDDAYYNKGVPLVSDAVYDAMVETLKKLDPSNPYLNKVGASVKSNKVGRFIPMGTLSKYHKEEEVLKWLSSEGDSILLSPKYDGFAVELMYDRGNLVAASTRGDGYIGEDVLKSAIRIKSVPMKLSKYCQDITIVRGEAIIPTRNHDKIKELGYNAMRNAVPGIVRSCREDALGYVDFVAYEFIDGTYDREIQRSYYYDDFIVEDYRVYQINEFEYMKIRRDDLRYQNDYLYELDGVVLKTNKIKDDDLLNPSHMIAWKYKSNRETTSLRGIEYQLGVTGYFTPIGIFDPVEFQGAILTRASLGNMTRLAEEFNGITLGSLIEVSRRGDIIPYIESLVLINDSEDEIPKLVTCPHCGVLLSYDGREPHCTNKSCPEKLRLQLSQYARALEVKGIGDKLVRGLIDAGEVKSIVDIYRIQPECILSIPRQGQSSVDKWKQLQSKKLSAVELLTAYPFLDLGRKVWEVVLSEFSLIEVLNLTKSKLILANLRGLGDSRIDSIISQILENKSELLWLARYHNLIPNENT